MPSGHEVHQKLKGMMIDYGVMMTGVLGYDIGRNQAAMMGPFQKKSDFEQAAEEMLTPMNSCGAQSNQICDLLLSEDQGLSFHEQQYDVLANDGQNLRNAISGRSNLLLRFEVDRLLAPSFVYVNRKINSIEKLREHLLVDDRIIKNRGLVLIDDHLYHTHINDAKKIIIEPLPCHESEKAKLKHIFLNQEVDDGEIYLEAPYGDAERNLVQLSKAVVARSEFAWTSNHSFTVFLTNSEDGMPHPFHYQAFMGRHTLQQWFASNKFQELSQDTPEQYIERLTRLTNAVGSQEVKKEEIDIFSQGGDDQRRLAASVLAHGPESMRVKFKCIDVDLELADAQLSELQSEINKNYPGNTRAAQLALYSEEAKTAMRIYSAPKAIDRQTEPAPLEEKVKAAKQFKDKYTEIREEQRVTTDEKVVETKPVNFRV